MILLMTLFGQSHITGGGATFYHTMSVQAYNALNCSHTSSELNTVHFGLRSALVAVWGQVASGVKLNCQAAAASTWYSTRHWNGPENKQAPQEYGNNNNKYRITETNKGLVGGHLTTQSVHHLCFIEDKYTSETHTEVWILPFQTHHWVAPYVTGLDWKAKNATLPPSLCNVHCLLPNDWKVSK